MCDAGSDKGIDRLKMHNSDLASKKNSFRRFSWCDTVASFYITPSINYFPEKYSTSVGRVSVRRVVYFEAENSVILAVTTVTY